MIMKRRSNFFETVKFFRMVFHIITSSHHLELLKVKLKESALVNVNNKNRCSLQINTLRCKLIYTIVKVRNVNAVSA
jgi:hypothetical protein